MDSACEAGRMGRTWWLIRCDVWQEKGREDASRILVGT